MPTAPDSPESPASAGAQRSPLARPLKRGGGMADQAAVEEVPVWLQEGEQERLLDLYRQIVGELRKVPKRRRPRRVA